MPIAAIAAIPMTSGDGPPPSFEVAAAGAGWVGVTAATVGEAVALGVGVAVVAGAGLGVGSIVGVAVGTGVGTGLGTGVGATVGGVAAARTITVPDMLAPWIPQT
jgi:hypothetical protein